MRRILGLDVGERTLGVAVSDELGLTAQAVGVRRRESWAADVAYIRALLQRYDADAVVVGLPRNMDGSLGPQAQKTLAFMARLQQACGVPVIAWDERLTTQQAERLLLAADASRRRRKQLRDQLAAQLVLQTYLERRAHHQRAPGSETGFVPQDADADAEDQQMRHPDAGQ
jgi:putative Holliday junction resolvase